MASAATGSAHHHPIAALRAMPVRAASDSQEHVVAWNASASRARLPSAAANRRYARPVQSIAGIDMPAIATPRAVGCGRSARASARNASKAM